MLLAGVFELRITRRPKIGAKALLHGETVEIIETSPTLTKVLREGDDPDIEAFWVKNKDLKAYGDKGQSAPRFTGPLPLPQPNQPAMDLEAYVESVGCKIWVETRSDYKDAVISQFEADAKRPMTPAEEKSIIIVENRTSWRPAEWRVTFKAPPPTVQYSYPHDTLKNSDTWRVNYKDFARYLISRGFGLGANSPMAPQPSPVAQP